MQRIFIIHKEAPEAWYIAELLVNKRSDQEIATTVRTEGLVWNGPFETIEDATYHVDA